MPVKDGPVDTFSDAINRGFSKQSVTYDEADARNKILHDLRRQVYAHAEKYLKPGSHILELNAGTGLDALYFVSKGHHVHATDNSDGMMNQIESKISSHDHAGKLTCQRLSYENLDQVTFNSFDFVFSNFGGLNCIQDLNQVTRHLPHLLKPGAYVTWVIMPPVCLWELLWIFKGEWKKAFRRLQKNGTLTHLEGEYFNTYYHSLRKIRAALGPSFQFLETEGLAALSPPPHCDYIPSRYPSLYHKLRKADAWFKDFFPFNRWADHIIVTFRYTPEL